MLIGQSGVGKSTLMNTLVPAAARATGMVNPVTGRGRHTSSSVVAIPLATVAHRHAGTAGLRAGTREPGAGGGGVRGPGRGHCRCARPDAITFPGCALDEWAREHHAEAGSTRSAACCAQRQFPEAAIAFADYAALPALLEDADFLVNTTSLGMVGQPPLAIDLAPLPVKAVVADIVYAPLETGLLRQAAARGLRTSGGLGMLLHQAVPGFARWFGKTPRVTAELRALVAADIAGQN